MGFLRNFFAKVNKRKLAIYAPVVFLLVGAGISLAAAKTGHFPALADALNIKADVGIQPVPNPCDVTVVSDTSNKVDRLLTAVNAYKSPSWTSSIPGASWIWISEKVQNPAINETHSFTKQFEWKGSTVSSAILRVASDNNYKAYINGSLVKSGGNFTSYDEVGVASQIKSGTNEIKVEVTNIGIPNSTPEGNTAGLLYKLNVIGSCVAFSATAIPTVTTGSGSGSLIGSVTNASGNPAQATVSINSNPVKSTTSAAQWTTVVGAERFNYSISNIPSGSYTVTASTGFQTIGQQPITIVAGQNARANFQIPATLTPTPTLVTSPTRTVTPTPTPTPAPTISPTIIEGNLRIAEDDITLAQGMNPEKAEVILESENLLLTGKLELEVVSRGVTHYVLTIDSSKFRQANEIKASVCAVIKMKSQSGNTIDWTGCWSTPWGSTNPIVMTVKKGVKHTNINIALKTGTKELKLKFYDSETNQPINLLAETITKNEIDCVFVLSNRTTVKCSQGGRIDQSDPSHSTFIYDLSNLSTDSQLSLVFESDKYIAPPVYFLQNNIPELDVKLTEKSKFNPDAICEKIGGTNFFYFPPDLKDQLTAEERSYLHEIGNIYFQLNLVAGVPSADRPTIVITNLPLESIKGQAWMSDFDIGCLKTKWIIALDWDLIKNSGWDEIVYTGVHELGHSLVVSDTLTLPEKDAIFLAFKKAWFGDCSEKYNDCFSEYAMTNPDEMWAEFFVRYFTDHQSIADARNDKEMSKECKDTLKYLVALMQKRFPHLPTFTPTFARASSASGGLALGHAFAATSEGFSANSLISSMNKVGYKELNTPSIGISVSGSAFSALTPTQILAGKWLQEDYDKLTPIQKANFNLDVVSSQVSMWVTNNRAVSYIRTQIANMSVTLENWLGALGFKFTSSKLTGTLLDQNGKPVSGFKITVGNFAGQGKFDITDGFGNYSVNRLPTGDQIIKINDPKNNNTSYAVYDYFTKQSIFQFIVAPRKNYTRYLMIIKQ